MLSFLQVALFSSLSAALYTPKGSPCAVDCATSNANFTGTSDLVCLDTAYTDSSKGVTLKSCISCLSKSTYVNTALDGNGNSDQWWYLWHIKYVQEYCLIDTPQTSAASNCSSKCNPLGDALDVSWIYKGAQPQYGYCSWNSSKYTQYGQDCATCMQEQEEGVIIGNFGDTLVHACASQPLAANGQIVSTARDLFNSATIGPTSSATASSTASSTASVTTTSSQSTASATSTSTSVTGKGLSSGASIGIGVGVGMAVLAATFVALFLYIRRRRSRAAFAKQANIVDTPYKPYNPAQEMDSQNIEEMETKGRMSPMEVEAKNRYPMQEMDATGGH